MAIKVYYDTDTNMCHVAGDDYLASKVRLSRTGDKVILEMDGIRLIDSIPVTELTDKEGNTYASYSDFRVAIKNFFVNAPSSGGAKWKTFKAIVQRVDVNSYVVNALNRDDDIFIDDVTFDEDLENAGVYKIKSSLITEANRHLTILNGINLFPSGRFTPNFEESNFAFGEIKFNIISDSGEYQIGFDELYIELSIRQRGTPPVLLSAETNEVGDKVILTFNKKMSDYNLNYNIYDLAVYSIQNDEKINLTNGVVNDNKIICTNQEIPASNTDILILSYDLISQIESFDYGLLAPFENFPVTNNVV